MNDFELLQLVPLLEEISRVPSLGAWEEALELVLSDGAFLLELAQRGSDAVNVYDYTRARKFSDLMGRIYGMLEQRGRDSLPEDPEPEGAPKLNAMLVYSCVMGKLCESEGDLAGAKACYERGIAALTQERRQAADWKNVARLLEETNRAAEEKFGKKSDNGFGAIALNDIAMVRNVEATLCLRRGDLEGALDRVQLAIEIFERLHGKNSLNVCDFYIKKGNVLQELGDRDAAAGCASGAEAHYRQAEERYETVLRICETL